MLPLTVIPPAAGLASGAFLGWSLGANDASCVFGTAVSSRMVRFRTAALLTSLFVILGAVLNGSAGMMTISQLTHQNLSTAFITAASAGLVVTIMTILKLPISVSQAVVGAVMGIGFFRHQAGFGELPKIVICWILTPVGAIIFSIILYLLLSRLLNSLNLNFIRQDGVLRTGLIVSGILGAYAMGANNVANVVGMFVDTNGLGLSPRLLALFGGVAISLGVVTFGKNVMYTVGHGLVPLDAFSALIAVLSQAVTVYIFALLGVPVSISQAMVGAVLGIGLLKGLRTINAKTVIFVLLGWVTTPVLAGLISWFVMRFV
jgi:inorganic phosphate transporter, PiT family